MAVSGGATSLNRARGSFAGGGVRLLALGRRPGRPDKDNRQNATKSDNITSRLIIATPAAAVRA